MNKNLVPIDPRQEPRTKRFMEILSKMLNEWIVDDVLNQSDDDSWGLAGLIFTGSGPPASTLGYNGDYYLDITGGILYKNQ